MTPKVASDLTQLLYDALHDAELDVPNPLAIYDWAVETLTPVVERLLEERERRTAALERLARILASDCWVTRDSTGVWWTDDWGREVEGLREDEEARQALNALFPSGRVGA